jgi:hypothetical protein
VCIFADFAGLIRVNQPDKRHPRAIKQQRDVLP